MPLTHNILSALEGLRPDPEFSVWEWSDKYRFLTSKSSSEPGPWRTSRIPYAYEIMECLSVKNQAREIIVKKGAQLGFTEIGNCWVGYIMACVPGPALIVQPDLKLAANFSRQRITPLIESSPALRDLVSEKKSRDSGNTILAKDFPGGMLVIGGSNSAAGLRSMPIRYLFLDEIDGYVKNVEGEGSPITLAEARTRTYQNKKKIYKISTPLLEGSSEVDAQYEQSSKEKYHVPCIHCGHFQELIWDQMRYDPELIDETCYYECIECKGELKEHHKTEMLRGGKWVAERPERKYVRGFHISSLYSPAGFLSWAQCAKDYEQARKKPELMQSFVNTTLGLCFRADTGETPDYQRLYERREDYLRGILPFGAVLMTAGVDVQADRLECQVVAWNSHAEKWLVDYKVFVGNVEDDSCWNEAEEYLSGDFKIEGSDIAMKISGFCVDSGFATPRVAAFCKRFPRNKCFMIKGVTTGAVLIGTPRQGEIKVNGQKIKTGLRVWNVNVDIAKSELYRHLNLPMAERGKESPRGYFHFHQDLELSWFRGLCSEELRAANVKGHDKFYFEKIYKRNEPLDTAVYARAAFAILGGDRWKDSKWKAMKDDLGTTKEILRRQHEAAKEKIVEIAVIPVTEEKVNSAVNVSSEPPRIRKRRKTGYL